MPGNDLCFQTLSHPSESERNYNRSNETHLQDLLAHVVRHTLILTKKLERHLPRAHVQRKSTTIQRTPTRTILDCPTAFVQIPFHTSEKPP